jgi:hypothetical protein
MLALAAFCVCQYAIVLTAWRLRWCLGVSLLMLFVGVFLAVHGWPIILEL